METKAGIKTTEFWLTLVAAVLGVAIAAGLLTPEEAANTQSILEVLVKQLAGVIIAAGPIIAYIKSRSDVKLAALMSSEE